MIAVKRAYDPVSRPDGTRFLVERLWPRGISKAALHIEGWLKDVAPSTELRTWFHHDPEKWHEFRRRYRRELDARTPGRLAADSGRRPLRDGDAHLQCAGHGA